MKCIWISLLMALFALCMTGCESSEPKSNSLPSRATDGGDLPWARPASWEGGLPGMGGVGSPASRF